jgi:hypothetical protein
MILRYGKYQGRAVCDVPDDYLHWLAEALRTTCAEIDLELRHRREQGIPPITERTNPPAKITEPGQPCRRCGAPVVRKTHTKPPKRTPSGYYFEWWLKCPSKNCRTLYMVEAAKRWFEQTAAQ